MIKPRYKERLDPLYIIHRFDQQHRFDQRHRFDQGHRYKERLDPATITKFKSEVPILTTLTTLTTSA